ncbi:MAG: SCO family protein [Casimicrobiaceae bacterium]
MSAPGNPAARRGTDARTRRMIVLIAAIAVAPIVLAYVAYYYWPRMARTNYGELLPAQTLPHITGTTPAGATFDSAGLHGKWVVLFAAPGECDPVCRQALYASRQARTIQNAERDRVQRVWLLTDAAMPAPSLLAEHPDLVVAHVAPTALAALPRGLQVMYLVDPLGNLVLAWPANPDIKAMSKDLSRLLHASQIG